MRRGGVEGSVVVREERRGVGMEVSRRGAEGRAKSVVVRDVRRGVGIEVSRRGGGMREEVEARARRPRDGAGEGMLDDIGEWDVAGGRRTRLLRLGEGEVL